MLSWPSTFSGNSARASPQTNQRPQLTVHHRPPLVSQGTAALLLPEKFNIWSELSFKFRSKIIKNIVKLLL